MKIDQEAALGEINLKNYEKTMYIVFLSAFKF